MGLTLLRLVDYFNLSNWTSPFRISGVPGVLSYFHFIFYRNSCMQTVQTLIRCHRMWHLICVYTVCLCPFNGTIGTRGLISRKKKTEVMETELFLQNEGVEYRNSNP